VTTSRWKDTSTATRIALRYVRGCRAGWPETRVEGIGQEAVRCANCGADATPFRFTNGYTIAFDEHRSVGVTVAKSAAESFGREAARFAALPDKSVQTPILTFAPHDIVGLATRLRPFMGQLGTSPSTTIPDSHNAGDLRSFLIGAAHRYALSAAEPREHKTDGHMDVDAVRAGAILICPVKLDGGGVYLTDVHALQGDGEIAGHTCDVSGTVTLQLEVVKGVEIDGPILFPLADDLPFLAAPLSDAERARVVALGRRYGIEEL
jgi:acetamidase/formamidase